MINKIIKFKELDFHSFKAGGGSPTLKPPSNIDNLFMIQNFLSNIPFFLGERVLVLIHNSEDELHRQTPIPAPSKRFTSSMKTIFGSSVFNYESTRYNKTKDKLEFLYLVNHAQIQVALSRLTLIINFFQLQKRDGESWSNMFLRITEADRVEFDKSLNELREKHNLKLFSFSSLTKLLCEQNHYFIDLAIDKEGEIETKNGEQGHLKFVSLKYLEAAEKALLDQYAHITYLNKDQNSLELNFEGYFKGSIQGVLKASVNPKQVLNFPKERILDTLESAISERFKLFEEDINQTWVGVIDGGISKNSILLDHIEYDDNLSLGLGKRNPSGHHAEEVVSLLLWTNKLNPSKANDFGTSPRVHLFNVLTDGDNIGQIKEKVETILKLHSSRIKIWNFSFVIQNIKLEESLSEMCVFFDYLQKKYQVLFIFATGNGEVEEIDRPIEAPAGSFRGISVSSVKSNGEPATYSLVGGGKYINSKPDLSIFGGDVNDKIVVISKNFQKGSQGGTSFAVPLVTRKVAQLYSFGFSLNAIPAILIAVAHYHSRNNILGFNSKIGFGVLPMNSRKIFELVENQALIVLDQEISSDYSQGFYKIKAPKMDGHFDQNWYFGINIDGTLEKHSTYEYVKDCTRISFGRIDPFDNKIIATSSHSTDDEEGSNESFLRAYRGKFKTRDVFKDQIQRPRQGIKKKKTGESKEIEYWGIKVVRNIIDSKRAKVDNQRISICIIVDCINNSSFYEQFISLNNEIIQEVKITIATENEIFFE